MIYVVVIILLAFIMVCWNGLVNKRNSVENALSTIDTCLQTRLDLMSNLFEQIAITFKHEKELYSEIVKLRTMQDDVKKEYIENEKKNIIEIDKKVSHINRQYLAIHENYPQISSIKAVCKAMDANIEVENQINAARRNYNNNVQSYRDAIQSFPNIIVAGILGFRNKYELYKADEGAEKRVSPKDFI